LTQRRKEVFLGVGVGRGRGRQLTLWALTNSLWMMLPAGPWPAPITTTSGSSSRELTNLEEDIKGGQLV